MIRDYFDINEFIPFQTSSGLDGSYVGNYEDKIVRVVRNGRGKIHTELPIQPENP